MPVLESKSYTKENLTKIAKSYNSLQHVPQLICWLSPIFPQKNLNKLSKFELHKILNDLLLNDYEGEYKFKYALYKKFHNQNLIAGFEMKVNNSRVDFVTINGHTTSYEIKTTIDDLRKLEKQANDYLSAFEYNNVIVHQKHVERCIEVLPNNFGIIIYNDSKQKKIRKAELNNNISPIVQLKLLSKQELFEQFNSSDVILISKQYKANQVNQLFKKALKKRYEKRWKFIVTNDRVILPIDLQFFFNTNISPNILYNLIS